MKNDRGKHCQWLFYSAHMLLPILLGTVLYMAFRPDTYIYLFFQCLSPISLNSELISKALPEWLVYVSRNYLPDVLWAYSLTFAVHFLWRKEPKVSVVAIVICVLFETAMEFFQRFGVLSGTFDWLDIVFECCATVLAALIIKEEKEKRK